MAAIRSCCRIISLCALQTLEIDSHYPTSGRVSSSQGSFQLCWNVCSSYRSFSASAYSCFSCYRLQACSCVTCVALYCLSPPPYRHPRPPTSFVCSLREANEVTQLNQTFQVLCGTGASVTKRLHWRVGSSSDDIGYLDFVFHFFCFHFGLICFKFVLSHFRRDPNVGLCMMFLLICVRCLFHASLFLFTVLGLLILCFYT